MASNEAARKTGEAMVISTQPDVCLTPMGPNMVPVPYPVIGKFGNVSGEKTTVQFGGDPAVTMGSRVTKVTGDEAGTGGGLVSGTKGGHCRPVTHSTSVRVHGEYVLYHSTQMWMNCAGPDGPGNTLGNLLYVKVACPVFVGENGAIVGSTNPEVKLETPEEKTWWQKAWDKTKDAAAEVATMAKATAKGVASSLEGLFDEGSKAAKRNVRDATSPQEYIFSEMKANIASPLTRAIARDNATPSWSGADFVLKKARAYNAFREAVDYNAPWDHKARILGAFHQQNAQGKLDPYWRDPATGREYSFDIWSNIHYGYVGRAAGFSAWELKSGAGLAQFKEDHFKLPKDYWSRRIEKIGDADVFSSMDRAPDQRAIELGAHLFDTYGPELTFEEFLKELGSHVDKLDTLPTSAGPSGSGILVTGAPKTSSAAFGGLTAEAYWKAYEKMAQKIIDGSPWGQTSPLTGKMVADAARGAYEAYGAAPSVYLALAQAQFESHMGTSGRSSKNNPYNVGEFDSGTKLTFDSTRAGVNAYMALMAKDYLNSRNETDLLGNFVNKNGSRYASNPRYEIKLRGQVAWYKKKYGTVGLQGLAAKVEPGQHLSGDAAVKLSKMSAMQSMWRQVDAPVKNAAGQRSRAGYVAVIDQFDVERSHKGRYRPTPAYPDTRCNIFAGDVMRAMGAPIPTKGELGKGAGKSLHTDPMTANAHDLNASLKGGQVAGWREVDVTSSEGLKALQDHLAAGKPVLASDDGHIAVVRPNGVPTPLTTRGLGNLHVAQAGLFNRNDATLGSLGYGKAFNPTFFIHD